MGNCWVMVNLAILMLLLIEVMEIVLLSRESIKIRYLFFLFILDLKLVWHLLLIYLISAVDCNMQITSRLVG